MNRSKWQWIVVVGVSIVAGTGGYWFGHRGGQGAQPSSDARAIDTRASDASGRGRNVLYWYDPMYPQQHFDKPGRSPFMEMALLPKYADEDNSAGVKIDPTLTQNLGVRLATVETGRLSPTIDAVGSVDFNERDVAVIQARTGGFVERVYARAPGDVVPVNAPIVDVLVPEWTAAQSEFLALQTTGDGALIGAARERLKLLGMPNDLIERVVQTRQPHAIVTIRTPIGGAIASLDVRAGMTVAPGMTLARVNGLSTVWIEAAVPENQAAQVAPGAIVEARLSAFPGDVFKGRIAAILPQANVETRTLRVRAEFPNPRGRLRPGLFAQMRIVTPAARDAVLVPAEAVIRTGKRALVIIAAEGNRYQPVEIEPGAEADGKIAVLKGLAPGQKVVVSGQFLIDSEASLTAAIGRMQSRGAAAAMSALHEGQGKVVALASGQVTIAHGPVPSLNWDAMTMPFELAHSDLAKDLKPGDTVRFGIRREGDRFAVVQIERVREAK
ncbi:MAG: efflux RND transporter periplasmic adaptor subunit [Sulfurifustis sp.]